MGEFVLECVRCRHRPGPGFHPRCPECGGLTDPLMTLPASLEDREDPYDRFFPLLPVADRSLLPADCRPSPMVHAVKLGSKIGLPGLYLKNETVHPTGSTKFRMAAVALAYLYENGVRHFCTSSTGNSSSAYACAIGHFPDMKMTLFTAGDFEGRVNYPDSPQVEHRVLEGASFASAFQYAAEYAESNGLVAERGFFNPGRREGLKIAWCEATDQVPGNIDWYVQAVSSGMGVYGTYKAARELESMGHINQCPALLCVQQESCAPMVRAWEAGSAIIRPEDIVQQPTGIAKAILRGDPSGVYPYMREITRASGGKFCAVSEDEIRLARRDVWELEGVDICFSAAAAVAGLIKMRACGRVTEKETVVVNLTGRDRVGGD